MNALLSVYVDRLSGLKESIENIEHFAKINNIDAAPVKMDKRKILT